MRTNVMQGLQVLRRTSAFLAEENIPAKMGPIAKHVEALNGVIARLTALAAEQEVSDRAFRDSARKAREQARALVREYARPVARQGKLLFPVDSELRASLRLPSRSISYEALIATVAGFVDRVEEHKAMFVEAGFGDDFVDTLRGAVKALEKTLAEKAEHYGRRSVATSGLVLEFARARDMMRKLDSMVAPRLEGTDRHAGWKTLSRFAREKREEKEEQGENAGSPPAPSTPAVNGDTSTLEGHAA